MPVMLMTPDDVEQWLHRLSIEDALQDADAGARVSPVCAGVVAPLRESCISVGPSRRDSTTSKITSSSTSGAGASCTGDSENA
jgi:hypothetical protein